MKNICKIMTITITINEMIHDFFMNETKDTLFFWMRKLCLVSTVDTMSLYKNISNNAFDFVLAISPATDKSNA